MLRTSHHSTTERLTAVSAGQESSRSELGPCLGRMGASEGADPGRVPIRGLTGEAPSGCLFPCGRRVCGSLLLQSQPWKGEGKAASNRILCNSARIPEPHRPALASRISLRTPRERRGVSTGGEDPLLTLKMDKAGKGQTAIVSQRHFISEKKTDLRCVVHLTTMIPCKF